MIFDALEIFDAAGTTITATATSTNILDVGILSAQPPGNGTTFAKQQRDIGPSYTGVDSLDIFVQIQTTFTSTTTSTLQVSIQAAVDAGATATAQTPGTWYDQVMTGAMPVANLTVGREVLRTPIPRWSVCAANVTTRPRFYRLNYTVGVAAFATGTIFAGVVSSGGRQDDHAYPSGIPATA
jgi:hypothetical protein